MKHLIKIIMVLSFPIAILTSCRKEGKVGLDTAPLGLGGDATASGPIDKWIYDSLTVPYNIAVKYRWDPWELALDKTLVPPDESKVIPSMSAVRNVCFIPYIQQTGSDLFIKKYAPKNFVLVGSAQYDYNGTITLGQAEGGSKITLFVLNYFSKAKQDSAALKQMVHTIHHEFGHILHQNVIYPVAYKSITVGYTATWFNNTDQQARALGFITAYAMSAPDEDFVEMISTMLTEGAGGYVTFLQQAGSPTSAGYLALKAKEAIVVNYFQTVYGIDFYALQTRCRTAFNNFIQ